MLFAQNMSAQNSQQIGFINSDELLEAMPEKITATKLIHDLNENYKAEFKKMEAEYNKNYSDFISYQDNFGETIRLRRMQQLYEQERQINQFMKIAQADIDEQERKLVVPLRKLLKEAIYQVGIEQGLFCIYDLSNPAIVFVTPNATDITLLVKEKLQKK